MDVGGENHDKVLNEVKTQIATEMQEIAVEKNSTRAVGLVQRDQ